MIMCSSSKIQLFTFVKLFLYMKHLLVNCELLLKFEADRSKSHFSNLISSAFIKMEEDFNVYIPYCKGYTNAINHLNDLIEVL